jgi:hypothetical membrane protein
MANVLKQVFSRKLTAICGIMSHLVIYIFIIVAILQSPWFSWINNAISDLGNIVDHPASAPFLNSGLVVGGLIMILFGIGMFLEIRGNTFASIGALTLLTSGIGLFFVGVFPENFIVPHFASAFTYFFSIIVGSILFGIAFVIRKSTRLFGIVTIILGMLAATALSLLQFPGIAIPEMIASVSQYVWILVICSRLLRGMEAIPRK